MTARAASLRGHTRGAASPERFSEWYSRNRARSHALFDLVADEAYYSRPIDLRHPIVFYEGHLPAFSFNTLVKRALGGPSIDAGLETLVRARHRSVGGSGRTKHRTSVAIARHRAAVRRRSRSPRARGAASASDLDRPGDPLLHRAEAAFTILEHEAMHQETLLYMWHRLPLDQKRRPQGYQPRGRWPPVPRRSGSRFLPAAPRSAPMTTRCRLDGTTSGRILPPTSPAFAMQRHDVTNADYLEFVNQRGPAPLFWERHGDAW